MLRTESGDHYIHDLGTWGNRDLVIGRRTTALGQRPVTLNLSRA
jgi:hypothetical protein